MKIILLSLLTFMTLCLSPLLANAATYNWYFSNDATGNPAGNDISGDGSIAHPWKTLTKAQNQINSLRYNDTVNLFFDRGDTWNFDTGAVSTTHTYGLTIDSTDPTVHIDAYGAGNKPIFDGLVTDFSTASSHNATTGPLAASYPSTRTAVTLYSGPTTRSTERTLSRSCRRRWVVMGR